MKTFKSFIQLDEINKQEDDELTEDKPLTLFKKDKRTFHPPKPDSHQSKTTMKHIDKPNDAEKKAAKDIKPGIKGVRDRLAMLDAAKKRGALKNEDVDLLSNLYDQLDESNQEIFLNQLEEDAEVLLAFAKTIAEE